MNGTRSLHVELRAGQSISMEDGRIVIQLVEKTGKVAQLRVTAPPDVAIQRLNAAPGSTGAVQARMGIPAKA